MLIYCDPPYEGTTNKWYKGELDYDKFKDVLKAQRGRVALSGEGHFYDDLGWQRHELEGVSNAAYGTGGQYGTKKKKRRTEVLYTNYDVYQHLTPMFLEPF